MDDYKKGARISDPTADVEMQDMQLSNSTSAPKVPIMSSISNSQFSGSRNVKRAEEMTFESEAIRLVNATGTPSSAPTVSKMPEGSAHTTECRPKKMAEAR